MTTISEADIEQIALDHLATLGWQTAHGPDIERDYSEVILAQRLRDALAELNPDLPADALDSAFRKLTRPEGSTLVARNREFHRMFAWGVTVEYRTDEGSIRGAQVRVVDFDEPTANDWLAVNQFTVTENKHTRRPDVVLFVNGLPLGVIELKNPADEDATIWDAWQQLQTYKSELPTLFSMNEMLMVSDGRPVQRARPRPGDGRDNAVRFIQFGFELDPDPWLQRGEGERPLLLDVDDRDGERPGRRRVDVIGALDRDLVDGSSKSGGVLKVTTPPLIEK